VSARNYSQSIGAGATITLPAGRYFYVRTAPNALDIVSEGNPGSPLRFIGISAGARFGPVAEGQGWKFLRVTSAVAQAVEIIISDDGDFEIAAAVTVTGTTLTAEMPATTVTDLAPVSRADASQGALFAANTSRRRITVTPDSANGGICYVRTVGGANNLAELQPGQAWVFHGTYALEVRNDTGAAALFYLFEES
jgi:hypothetical protein